MSNPITFPRKKHSHRCPICGQGTYCYKKQCTKPQRIRCLFCIPPSARNTGTPLA